MKKHLIALNVIIVKIIKILKNLSFFYKMNIHILSPLIYIFFVKVILFVKPIPNSNLMKEFRKSHNISLSILSLFMLISITYSNYITNKIYPINNLLCKSYNNNLIANFSVLLFLYSKYLEWGDTIYLQLSGKTISTLHYTHHMTTAFVVYFNYIEYISPHMYIFMGSNCFVHILMYWYYAYPKGILFKFRKFITQLQIIQHIICLSTLIYTFNLKNCEQNKYGSYIGFFCYLMYLIYFVLFYIKTYFKKLKK
jgi:hypothetical protein